MSRIRKTSQTTTLPAQTVNTYSDSTEDAYACDYANKAFGGIILWTNSDPTSDFAPQNITVDLSNYDAYEIKYYSTKGDQLVQTTGILPKIGIGTKLFMFFNATGNSFMASRQVDFITGGLKFYDAYAYVFTAGSEGTFNNRLIPLYIIGYKTGVF